MRSLVVTRLFVLCALVALPVSGTRRKPFDGTVTDSTGAVLPGVTVTAVLQASGNRFVAVTDERGVYPIPAASALTLTASWRDSPR